MTSKQIIRVLKLFFKSGCNKIDFPQCEDLRKDYRASLGGTGCSSCTRRRMKNKFGRLIKTILKDKQLSDVLKEE